MIRFLDPRAEPGTPIDPYELSLDATKGPLTIGLLANGFPDSVAFLDHVESALGEALPEASFARYDKGDPTTVVSEQMIDEISQSCEAVVAAYGH